MKILVTGIAGFIGMHVGIRLLLMGHIVFGIDNINDYYDTNLKLERLKYLKNMKNNFFFVREDITNVEKIKNLFSKEKFDIVIHLAAQAGVRYSIINPHAYIESNVNGFLNILEGCRQNDINHLVYASSSSVYGLNEKVPFNEDSITDHPKSLYAATKKSNELMAHAYADLYNLSVTGLRFFTVYGPWGRPDMALFLFTKAIFSGESINLYNQGNMERDFTYIDDITEAIIKLSFKPAKGSDKFNKLKPRSSISSSPYQIFNIGNSAPVSLKIYIQYLEEIIGRKATINLMPMQSGDVRYTSSNTKSLENYIGFKPNTNIKVGIKKFILWYKRFYNV